MAKFAPGTAVRAAAAAFVIASLVGCGRADADDGAGFHDGFLAGYTRDCTIRSQPGRQRWPNPAYSRAYADGIDAGVTACRELRNRRDGEALAVAARHMQANHR